MIGICLIFYVLCETTARHRKRTPAPMCGKVFSAYQKRTPAPEITTNATHISERLPEAFLWKRTPTPMAHWLNQSDGNHDDAGSRRANAASSAPKMHETRAGIITGFVSNAAGLRFEYRGPPMSQSRRSWKRRGLLVIFSSR